MSSHAAFFPSVLSGPARWSFAVLLALSAAGCSKDSEPDAESAPSVSEARPRKRSASSSAASGKPAPEASVEPKGWTPAPIEPPSRDILPGSAISDATAKGAVGDSTILMWKENVEVWVDRDVGIVSLLRFTYSKAELDAARAKWGKPNVGTSGEAWLGKEWLAKLEGCSETCVVSFTRSPLLSLGERPALPGALSAARPGMTAAEVKAAAKTALPLGPGSDNGFGWELVASFDSDDKLEEVTMNPRVFDPDLWTVALVERWGEPSLVDGSKVWRDATAGWQIELGGTTLLTFRAPP